MGNNNYKVFISHAREDTDVAKLLSGYIEALDADYVLDAHHIDGGADFYNWMCDQIKHSHELLILASPAAIVSNCVNFELGLAAAHELYIAPILYRMGLDDLKASKIGQSLFARKTALTLEQFDLYVTQLSSRIEQRKQQLSIPMEVRLANELSQVFSRMRSRRDL